MVGMLQILTWMFGFYIVLKGIEIVQISVASARTDRRGMIVWALIVLVICVAASLFFITQQENMAQTISSHMPG